MKTKSLRAGDIQKNWYLVDANGLVVGRLASAIAKIMRGKTDPRLTPHMDHGGRVIVVNADKVIFTGRKREDKFYYRHTGYPGGIKSVQADKVLTGRYPERVLEKAVERMMGAAGPLRRQRMKGLFVYGGSEHPHAAQNPVPLSVGQWNPKNAKLESVS